MMQDLAQILTIIDVVDGERQTHSVYVFLMLSLLSDFDGCTVLDIGSGLGDFFGFLIQENIKADYMGIDVSQVMVKDAIEKYPQGKFQNQDFLDKSYQDKFDYIVASGAWSMRVDHQEQYLYDAIRKMFAQCHQAIAFNLLSIYAPEKHKNEERFFYYDPVKILEFCLSLTSFVELKQNYHSDDFTVFMYR